MYSVAIDGPSGVGKSSLARAVAKQFGMVYVDTGALYRCIGLYCVQNGIDSADSEKVVDSLKNIKIDLRYVDGEQKVYLDGEDVSQDIRKLEVGVPTSNAAGIPQVRDFLKKLQQDMAKTHDVVMDGRDIGTAILPRADVKFFITADPKERAQRRFDQLMRKGKPAEYGDILKDIMQRDKNDTGRLVAPLKAADDAVVIDTTKNTKEETVEVITSIIRSKLK